MTTIDVVFITPGAPEKQMTHNYTGKFMSGPGDYWGFKTSTEQNM